MAHLNIFSNFVTGNKSQKRATRVYKIYEKENMAAPTFTGCHDLKHNLRVFLPCEYIKDLAEASILKKFISYIALLFSFFLHMI